MDSEEKAYSEGHNAYHDGHRLKSNPYKRFTKEWIEWKAGWEDEKKTTHIGRRLEDCIKTHLMNITKRKNKSSFWQKQSNT